MKATLKSFDKETMSFVITIGKKDYDGVVPVKPSGTYMNPDDAVKAFARGKMLELQKEAQEKPALKLKAGDVVAKRDVEELKK